MTKNDNCEILALQGQRENDMLICKAFKFKRTNKKITPAFRKNFWMEGRKLVLVLHKAKSDGKRFFFSKELNQNKLIIQ